VAARVIMKDEDDENENENSERVAAWIIPKT
jgi:hypothetical protein